MTPQEHVIPQEGAVVIKVCSSRQCEQVGILQPIDNFSKNRTTRDGVQSFCRKCLSRIKRAREKTFPRIPDDQIKVCSGCDTPKFATEFYTNKKMADGIGGWCKNCATKASAVWAEENKDRMSSKAKEWISKNPDKVRLRGRKSRIRNWAAKAVANCRNRALKKGVPFDMKKEDLFDRSTGNLPEFCPIFPHIRLDYKAGPDRRCWPSVDRIVPELGYVTGNVWIVSFGANFWKSNGSNEAERKRIVEIMTGKKSTTRPKDDNDGHQRTLFAL